MKYSVEDVMSAVLDIFLTVLIVFLIIALVTIGPVAMWKYYNNNFCSCEPKPVSEMWQGVCFDEPSDPE